MERDLQEILSAFREVNGVFEAHEPSDPVPGQQYLGVRKAENRIHSDEEVKMLPYLNNHMHAREWKLRARSFNRLSSYFRKGVKGNVLDLGCGNGWFAGRLAGLPGLRMVGMDVNKPELEQAARVFGHTGASFVYGDVFEAELPPACFQAVTLGASVQYFLDLDRLIERLFHLMPQGGELHIFDSPFYEPGEVDDARQRSRVYYENLGFPLMADHYFHHDIGRLRAYQPEFMYKPPRMSLFRKMTGQKDIPFPWIRIRKGKLNNG